jgi:hypothetical protein
MNMMLLQVQNDGSQAILAIFSLLLRFVGAAVCASKAKELNRSSGGWGFFGFFMPIVAMIWIYNKKPNIEWNQKTDLK